MRQVCILLICFILSCKNNQKDVDEKSQTETISPETSLKNAVKQYPDSVVLLENLLGYYVNAENYDSALSAINMAVTKDSGNPILFDMQSVIFAAKGDTANAIISLEKAILIYPSPAFIISLGSLYAQTKNPSALEMADALLIGSKANAEKEAYFIKGIYYSFINQKEKAIPFFDKALSTDFQFMEAYLEKGIALYDLKKYKESAEVLNKAVTLRNNFDRGYFYLGRSLEKINKTAEARMAYVKAIMYDPNYEEAKAALNRLGQEK